jgi:hypothetical protein
MELAQNRVQQQALVLALINPKANIATELGVIYHLLG